MLFSTLTEFVGTNYFSDNLIVINQIIRVYDLPNNHPLMHPSKFFLIDDLWISLLWHDASYITLFDYVLLICNNKLRENLFFPHREVTSQLRNRTTTFRRSCLQLLIAQRSSYFFKSTLPCLIILKIIDKNHILINYFIEFKKCPHNYKKRQLIFT